MENRSNVKSISRDFTRFIFENIARTSSCSRNNLASGNEFVNSPWKYATREEVKRIRLPVLQIFPLPAFFFSVPPERFFCRHYDNDEDK